MLLYSRTTSLNSCGRARSARPSPLECEGTKSTNSTTFTPEQHSLTPVVGRVAPDLLPWIVRELRAHLIPNNSSAWLVTVPKGLAKNLSDVFRLNLEVPKALGYS
ncbi:hypothetical protein Ddc_00953 [Ditylenchus destructor]|nr:hypothetical protein Ddc_00953 [Ditylenchus destructor]